jgi:Pentatricopeptide repeat domain
MKAWADKGRRDKCDSVLMRMLSAGYKPDPISCRLLLSVHASTDLADSAERTEEALQRLLQAGVRMDEHLLISQLQAWSKSRSPIAANKAETALAKGLASGVPPSAALFNVLLDTHGKSKQPDSPLVCMIWHGSVCNVGVILIMVNCILSVEIKYTIALTNYSLLSTSPLLTSPAFSSLLILQRAEGVLRRMKEAGITPEICSYNAAVAAWGR